MSRNAISYILLVLISCTLPIIVLPQTAGAWSFVSDGAVPNGRGGWDWTQASASNKQCLACHNPTVMPDSDKTGYLMTGHKNVLRMMTAGISATYWEGPAGQVYQTDTLGRTIDFLNGWLTMADGSKAPLYYIYGDWMTIATSPNVIYGEYSNSQGSQPGSGYTCAKCHTTGYGAVAAKTFIPYNSPGNNITVANTFLYNAQPGTLQSNPDPVLQTVTQPSSAVSAQINYNGQQWVFDGVTCTRCHDVTPQYGADEVDFAPVPTNQDGTALCYGCHQNPPGQNTVDMAGNSVTPDNFYPALYLPVGDNGTYMPTFTGYPITQEFLNSPHGRFSGVAGQNNNGLINTGQINNPAYYASQFNDGAGNNLGCTAACHDPHQSTVDAVMAATGDQPMVVTCDVCHTEIVLSQTAHPSSPGTPLAATGEGQPCVICHMLRPDNGKAVRLHLFRINVDASYGTFPAPSQFNSGRIFPNTADDGSAFPGRQAVWVDLDLACGQCHGGGTAQITTTGSLILSSPVTLTVANGSGFTEGQKIMITGAGAGGADFYTFIAALSGNTVTLTDAAGAAVSNATVTLNPTQNNAPYKTKIELAGDAYNIHGTYPSPNFTWLQTVNSNTVSFNASSTVCPSGGICTFSWAFGDGVTDNSNSIMINHSYTSALPGVNPYSVTLTITNTNAVPTQPQSITKTATVNIPPTVSESASSNNLTVTLVDRSTAGSSISINWGDGSTHSTGSAGGAFTHIYASANTYTIVATATLQGLSVNQNIAITVPAKFTVSGTVTSQAGNPLQGVSLSLKLNGLTKGLTTTDVNGNYTFINVVPGTYTVNAVMTGYTFASPALSGIVVSGNVTGENISSSN